MQATSQRLLTHPLLSTLTTLPAWRTFMEHHVFAVWDFMSLLKRLQRDLTGVDLPWTPPANAAHARLINEIVLEEESDLDAQGRATSHFELYLHAMQQCGANTLPVRRFVRQLQNGTSVGEALSEAPACVQPFVQHTLHLAQHGSTEEVCSAFFWGREELIPPMFLRFVERMQAHNPALDALAYYFRRHITLDSADHGPRAKQLLDSLVGQDATKQARAQRAAEAALQARYALWSGIHTAMG